MALAFGLQSGLSAAAGIYGAIFLSFFAALFGGTSTQISGPTAPMTAVSMVVIASIIASMEGEIINRIGDKVYIRHPDGPLFFGFASRSQDMIKAMPDISVVIIRMDKVPFVDQSGLYAMEDAVMDLQAQNIKVVFTDLHGQPLDMFERFNLIPGLEERKYCFDDFNTCSIWLEGYLKANHNL